VAASGQCTSSWRVSWPRRCHQCSTRPASHERSCCGRHPQSRRLHPWL
jgi:hypothetical protein